MTDPINNRVVKIRKSWELAAMDDKGNMLLEYTQEHNGGLTPMDEKKRNLVSKKIMKELESRMKL